MGMKTKDGVLTSSKQKTESKAPAKKPVSRRAAAATPDPVKVKYFKDGEKKKFDAAAYVADKNNFHPSVVEWMKDNFGVAMERLPERTLVALRRGEVTPEMRLVVTPTYYDANARQRVVSDKVVVVNERMRFRFPFDAGKPCNIDAKHPVFMESFPARPFVEALSDEQLLSLKREAQAAAKARSESGESQPLPKFSEAQMQALETIGIDRDRLFAGQYNAIPVEAKQDLLDGYPVLGDGTMKIQVDGGVRDLYVYGQMQMITAESGEVLTKFDSFKYVPRAENEVLDLEGARRKGTIELSIYKRDEHGAIERNIYEQPVLSEGAQNLLKYGNSLMAMEGFDHSDPKRAQRGMFYVTVIDGNLAFKRMEWKNDLAADGSETKKGHYEVSGLMMKGDQVYMENERAYRDFASAEDAKLYRMGQGGVIKDCTWVDYSEKGPVKTKHDLVVIPAMNGFAKPLSPEKSAEIISARAAAAAKKSASKEETKAVKAEKAPKEERPVRSFSRRFF